MNKTELEIFAEYTIKNGGKWFLLEDGTNAKLYKSQMWHLVGNNYVGDAPVYQVFDSNGKRIYSTTNLSLAYSFYENNCDYGE